MRKVSCPQCGRPAMWVPENPWRPFCSERCQQIDLGGWATGTYRIAGSGSDDDSALPRPADETDGWPRP